MSTFNIIRPTADESAADGSPSPVQLATDPHYKRSEVPYIISDDLATAVNVAISLGQPLLVTGEPGTGKTSLAWAVARQLGTDVLEFHTKSTSSARDLFYSFDALRRFYDANTHDKRAEDPNNYIEYQALGQAIRSPETHVVLIDEIDKAPKDFPNDLLNELDQMEFSVTELAPPPVYRADARHMVLITSNEERRLPKPFLRRCVYHHIPFPEKDELVRIVQAHLPDLSPALSFVNVVVERFMEIRSIRGLSKPPATGELLSWVRVILQMGLNENVLCNKQISDLPGLETLIKERDDWLRTKQGG